MIHDLLKFNPKSIIVDPPNECVQIGIYDSALAGHIKAALAKAPAIACELRLALRPSLSANLLLNCG